MNAISDSDPRLARSVLEAQLYKSLFEEQQRRANALEVQLALRALNDSAATTGAQAAQAPVPGDGPSDYAIFAKALVDASTKQRAFFVAVVMGHGYGAIAEAVGVSRTTVTLQVHAVLMRLGLSVLAQLEPRREAYRGHLGDKTLQHILGLAPDWLSVADPVFLARLAPSRPNSPLTASATMAG